MMAWPLIVILYEHAVTRIRKVLVLIGVTLIFIGMTGLFRDKEPPMNIIISLEPNNYPIGADIDGIKWEEIFSGARVNIVNEEDSVYSNVDIILQADMLIWEYRIISKINECKGSIGGMFSDMTMRLSGNYGNSHEFTMPSAPSKSSIIRIHCDKLLSKSGIDVLLAFVTINRTPSRESPSMMLPRSDPKWVDAKIDIEFGGNAWEKYKVRCFDEMNKCNNINEEKEDVRALGSITIPNNNGR